MGNGTVLIPIPEQGEFTELQDIRKKKYGEALKNLITGKTPKDVIFRRPARGGMQVDYVPGWWFIEQLNALFGHLWDFDVIEQSIGVKQVWVKGKLTIKLLEDNLTVSKTAFGGSDIKTKKDTGDVIDIGDDLKAAATDALKKAATLLGLASDIYGKREVQEQTSPQKSQLDTLYKVGKDKGMDRDKVDDYCIKKYGKTPEELEVIAVLGLINEVRSMTTAVEVKK